MSLTELLRCAADNSILVTRITSLATLFLLGAGSRASAETLYYGSRAGMEVTIIGKTDIGSNHAKIVTKHTKANATSFCREYVGKVTAKCIAETLAIALSPTISANCETGRFTTLAGQGYVFSGISRSYDPTNSSEFPEYLIFEVGEKEPLKDYGSSAYGTAIDQFKALCPNRAKK